MENRRYGNSTNADDRTYNRDRSRTKPTNSTAGERSFQPRESGFRSRNDGPSPRPNNYRPTDNAPRSANNNYKQRDNRYAPRDAGYRQRENKFRTGTTNESGDTRYRTRDGVQSRDNRFQSRDTRDSRNNRFDARRRPPVPRGKAPDKSKVLPKPKIVSDLQITDGKHIGKYLQNTASPKVKPTMRKLREVMLRILSRRLRGGRFLDLFAGAGIVGFEAISRGALLGTFVERSARMVGLIKKNRDAIGIKEGHAEIFEIEVAAFLKQMAKRRRHWDVVFCDPPYDTNYDEILQYLGRGVCIKPKGVLVIEHHSEMFFPENLGSLKRTRVITEEESSLTFYERR